MTNYKDFIRKQIPTTLNKGDSFTVNYLFNKFKKDVMMTFGVSYNKDSFKNAINSVIIKELIKKYKVAVFVGRNSSSEKIYMVKEEIPKLKASITNTSFQHEKPFLEYRKFARIIFSDLPVGTKFTRKSLQEKYISEAMHIYDCHYNQEAIIDALGYVLKHEAHEKYNAVTFETIENKQIYYTKIKDIPLVRGEKLSDFISKKENAQKLSIDIEYDSNAKFSKFEIGDIIIHRQNYLEDKVKELEKKLEEKTNMLETYKKDNLELYEELEKALKEKEKLERTYSKKFIEQDGKKILALKDIIPYKNLYSNKNI